MKITLTVLFVLAMLVSSTQTFRHVYVKWVEPNSSVLDEFRDETETNIVQAKNLDELVNLYRGAHKDIKDYESNPSNPEIDYTERDRSQPYKSERKIKSEITAREYDQNQLFKLCFYWVCGAFALLLGIFVFNKVNQWIGVSGIIVGFSEMLCWTSPLFHNRILSQQFEHLLNYKLTFSIITWFLLVTLWLLIEKKNFLHISDNNQP